MAGTAARRAGPGSGSARPAPAPAPPAPYRRLGPPLPPRPGPSGEPAAGGRREACPGAGSPEPARPPAARRGGAGPARGGERALFPPSRRDAGSLGLLPGFRGRGTGAAPGSPETQQQHKSRPCDSLSPSTRLPRATLGVRGDPRHPEAGGAARERPPGRPQRGSSVPSVPHTPAARPPGRSAASHSQSTPWGTKGPKPGAPLPWHHLSPPASVLGLHRRAVLGPSCCRSAFPRAQAAHGQWHAVLSTWRRGTGCIPRGFMHRASAFQAFACAFLPWAKQAAQQPAACAIREPGSTQITKDSKD